MYHMTTGDGITVEIQRLEGCRWDYRTEVSHWATNIRPCEFFCGGQAAVESVTSRLLGELHAVLAEQHPEAAERERYQRLVGDPC